MPAARSPAGAVPGKPEAVGAAPAGTYGSAHHVATTAGNKEPLLDVRIGSSTFKALLDTGSSVSFLGPSAAAVAQACGAKPKEDIRALRLASGWSQSTTSLKCRIEWTAGCRIQQFLCVPDLCRDVVLGRDFLTVSGVSLHVALGGWTVGTEPQRIKSFVKADKERTEAVEDCAECLRCIFAEDDATVNVRASALITTAACSQDMPSHSPNLDPRMKLVLDEFRGIFTTIPGCTTLAEHHIDTGDNPPVRCKLRPVNAKKQAIMDDCIHDLLAQNLIRPSRSQHASAPVLVEKKSGGYRLAVDYRQLNARTKVPVYPMPRTDWLLAQLGRARWFSSFDLSQGFFQIPVREQDIPKTAFICHQGTFEFMRMPFGVAGGPATFQTLMDRVLEGINHQYAMAFLDDVLVYSETLEDHIEHVREVLRRISSAQLTINPEKVHVCCQSLKFLGHEISPGQCRPDKEKVLAILEYPQPTTVKQLQAFLGLAGYYRGFIPQFSITARPLTELLKKKQRWHWDPQQDEAFRALKQSLAQDVVVSLPDLNRPFVVETDASGVGIAAVLLQAADDNAQLRPICFISRVLTEAEQRYTVQEWECLAVVWAVDKFRPYLEFTEFEVHCDHSSLSWMFTTDQTSPRVRRWVLRLQGFNCKIKHRRGLANVPADALSRAPLQRQEVPVPSLHETLFPVAVPEPSPQIRFEAAAAVSAQDDTTVLNDPKLLAQEQDQDPMLCRLRTVVKGGKLPPGDSDEPLIRDLAVTTELEDSGLLVQHRGNRKVTWIPDHLRKLILRLSHDHPTSGHFGFFKTFKRISQHFVWLGLRSDIAKYVRCCQVCQRTKAHRQKPEGLMSSQWATAPMEQLSVDIVGPLPMTPRRHKYLLVVIDKFTKYIELFPLRSATSKSVVDCMVQVFCRHGTPVAISSDNGKPFVSSVWKGLLEHWGIQDRHTVPYRPAGQMVERHNGTIKQCLRAYCSNHKDWDQHIPEIGLAMRTAESVVTGYTPAFLCYGRELRTPWTQEELKDDVEPQATAYRAFAAEVSNCLQEVLEFSRQHQDKMWRTQKAAYDRHRRPRTIQKGDLVLLESHFLSDAAKGFSSKLAPRRSGPFRAARGVGQNDFVLVDPKTGRRRGLAHADQLTPYHDAENV